MRIRFQRLNSLNPIQSSRRDLISLSVQLVQILGNSIVMRRTKSRQTESSGFESEGSEDSWRRIFLEDIVNWSSVKIFRWIFWNLNFEWNSFNEFKLNEGTSKFQASPKSPLSLSDPLDSCWLEDLSKKFWNLLKKHCLSNNGSTCWQVATTWLLARSSCDKKAHIWTSLWTNWITIPTSPISRSSS